MTTKQSSAFHETLPGSAASVATVGRIYWILDPAGTGRYIMATDPGDSIAGFSWVLDPAGTGRYIAATDPSDGLGQAWFTDPGNGRLHLSDIDLSSSSIFWTDAAWFVENVDGRLQLNTDSAGASRPVYFPSSGFVLL